MKIDFVVTWVDSNDRNWQTNKAKYCPDDVKLNDNARYRDSGLFKYWFRSVEKYAPWVNKIFLVTEGHLPEWIDISNEKIVHVKHSDYIPEKYLPTFNSNVIELNLHRIEELSEYFVLFNDDLFLNSEVHPEDFFKNKLPKELGIYSPIPPHDEYSMMVFNDVRIINKHFSNRKNRLKNWRKLISYKYGISQFRNLFIFMWNDAIGYFNQHITTAFLKSTFFDVWEKEEEALDQVCMNKFRTMLDLNQWLMRYWQIENGKFEPRDKNFGVYLNVDNTKGISKEIKGNKKVLCINDISYDDMNAEKEDTILITKLFEEKFPSKSIFEL
ncbi:stealth family protein [Floricoccus penangensis]|uniref:stealth family protein n=1 Tax=Floricoccus penangensis TaxID=1859475 RepID=UPI00203BF4CD|nr:stealth family protein [Floricoccus penangensis]URZ87626.1 Stealth CR1 domain-containing protein [Floricoccus penangensis]